MAINPFPEMRFLGNLVPTFLYRLTVHLVVAGSDGAGLAFFPKIIQGHLYNMAGAAQVFLGEQHPAPTPGCQ